MHYLKKGIISTYDHEAKKLEYLQAERNFKNMSLSISQLNETIINAQKTSKGTQINKTKEKEKWKTMTQKLGQKISYLIKEDNSNNKDFFKFVELKSVPRYILIDKNMNLIDEAFLHPQEQQFLPKLENIKYTKYK